MISHENRLLADDSPEISYFFFRKLGKMSQNLSYTAVVIGALRGEYIYYAYMKTLIVILLTLWLI